MSQETIAAVTDFTKAATERLTALEARLSENIASTRALEQHVTRSGGDIDYPSTPGELSRQVIDGADLDALRSGAAKSVRIAVRSLMPDAQRAAITSQGMHTPPERDSAIYGPNTRAVSIRSLLPSLTTNSAAIEYLRYTRTGDAAIQAAEGDAKAETAFNFTLVQAPVKTVAVWVPASRQALDDNVMLQDVIDVELRAALILEEDRQLLKGDGTGANIKGLWSEAAAYSRAVTGDKPSDTIRRACTQIQLARGVASGIVLNPVALEELELERDSQGRHLAVVEVNVSGVAVLWRVPVAATDAIAANEFLVGDFTRAARLWDRQQATVEVATQHADFFTRNLVAILAEERIALTVPHPELLVRGTFAAAP